MTTLAPRDDNDHHDNNHHSKKAKLMMTPVSSIAKRVTVSTKITGPSMVQNLGVSGTAMAFIPTAARRRSKRETTVITDTTVGAASSLEESKDGNAKVHSISSSSVVPTTQNASASLGVVPDTPARSCEMSRIDTTIPSQALAEQSHTVVSSNQLSVTIPANESKDEMHRTAHLEPRDESTQRNHERRLRLREQVEQDPYDPMVPNDLLEYWERQAAHRAWEEQEHRRMVLEQQRIELEQQHRHEPDYPTETPRREIGKGRGRGNISNLPAWLVEKQKREAEGLGSESGS